MGCNSQYVSLYTIQSGIAGRPKFVTFCTIQSGIARRSQFAMCFNIHHYIQSDIARRSQAAICFVIYHTVWYRLGHTICYVIYHTVWYHLWIAIRNTFCYIPYSLVSLGDCNSQYVFHYISYSLISFVQFVSLVGRKSQYGPCILYSLVLPVARNVLRVIP